MNNYNANLLENRDNRSECMHRACQLGSDRKETSQKTAKGISTPDTDPDLVASFTAFIHLVLFLKPSLPCSLIFFSGMRKKNGIVV